jgi:YihY family inner membrane protein
MADKEPKGIDKIVSKADAFQRRYAFANFSYAVIKKYGDDEAGNRGALITYFGFLSLFPLLLVLTSILNVIFRNNEEFRNRILTSLANYFPVLGNELQTNIHSFHKTGLALIIGIILTLYGARGGAVAFSNALNNLWEIPRPQRGGFPLTVVRSLAVILIAGIGFIAAALFSNFATSLGHSMVFSVMAVYVSIFILFCVFMLIFNLSISTSKISYSDFWLGSLVAACGIQLLQLLGFIILTHQLKSLSLLYGTFAIVLGLLFWIYLQVQVVLYAVEIDTVRSLKLWPRSLSGKNLTDADKRAYSLYAKKERFLEKPPQEVRVEFKQK